MNCPDCGGEMIKARIQCEDLRGWSVGWLCDCKPNDENIQMSILSANDWTSEIIADKIEE